MFGHPPIQAQQKDATNDAIHFGAQLRQILAPWLEGVAAKLGDQANAAKRRPAIEPLAYSPEHAGAPPSSKSLRQAPYKVSNWAGGR
jgi:hypothetical protein